MNPLSIINIIFLYYLCTGSFKCKISVDRVSTLANLEHNKFNVFFRYRPIILKPGLYGARNVGRRRGIVRNTALDIATVGACRNRFFFCVPYCYRKTLLGFFFILNFGRSQWPPNRNGTPDNRRMRHAAAAAVRETKRHSAVAKTVAGAQWPTAPSAPGRADGIFGRVRDPPRPNAFSRRPVYPLVSRRTV